jgi:hypothetical protein
MARSDFLENSNLSAHISTLKNKILTELEKTKFESPNDELAASIKALSKRAELNRQSLGKEWNEIQQQLNSLQPSPPNDEEIQYNISCVMFMDELKDLLQNTEPKDQVMLNKIAKVQQAFLNLHTQKVKLMEEQDRLGDAYNEFYDVTHDAEGNLIENKPRRSAEETASYNKKRERYKQQIEEYLGFKDSFNDAINALPQGRWDTLKIYGHQLLHYLKMILAKPMITAIIGTLIAPVVVSSLIETLAMAFVGGMIGLGISYLINTNLFEITLPKEQKNIDSAKKKLVGSAKLYREKVKKSKEQPEQKERGAGDLRRAPQ